MVRQLLQNPWVKEQNWPTFRVDGRDDVRGPAAERSSVLVSSQICFRWSTSGGQLKLSGASLSGDLVAAHECEYAALTRPILPPLQYGRTPLYMAALQSGSQGKRDGFHLDSEEDCVSALISLGADPLAASNVRMPLPSKPAPVFLRCSLCKPFLSQPPPPSPQDGYTPLEVARSPGVRHLLLQAVEADRSSQGTPPARPLVAGLQGLREKHTDVELVCGGETLRCHSLVLAAQGEFWEALFFGPLSRCVCSSDLPF